jgi:hypothetical protein
MFSRVAEGRVIGLGRGKAYADGSDGCRSMFIKQELKFEYGLGEENDMMPA